MALTPSISSQGSEGLRNFPEATQHVTEGQNLHLALLASRVSVLGHCYTPWPNEAVGLGLTGISSRASPENGVINHHIRVVP